MKVCHTLICLFFLSLQDGNTGLVGAQIIVYTGTEGGDVTVECPNSFSRRRKFFCKEKCTKQDILIETTDVKAQNGRYSIEWKTKGASTGTVSVTITQLTKSDSGDYRCGSGVTGLQYIEIVVVDALLDEDVSEVKTLDTRTGGNITVGCSFTSSGSRKYFCKGACEEKDILVETTGYTAQTDRYSIRYVEGFTTGGSLYVSITQLTTSDSGLYGCGLNKRFSQDPYQEFRIIVSDAPTTSQPNLTLPAFPPSAATTQSSNSSASPGTTEQSATTTTTDVLLYVSVTLVVIVLLALSVLIMCRKRISKPKEPPVETQYAYATETNQVYEDIREGRQSGSPPEEISSIYTYGKYIEPNGAETSDDYSVVTAANSQDTADLSRLTYSQLNFSNQAIGSSNRALHGNDDNVVYSVPRV